MRVWQQPSSQRGRADRVSFGQYGVAPTFVARKCHEKSEADDQRKQCEYRLLQRGHILPPATFGAQS